VAYPHTEIGADDLQMIAGKDFALIGVELFGEAAAARPDGSNPKTSTAFRSHNTGREESDANSHRATRRDESESLACGQFEGGAEHHVGHPQLVGQSAFEGLGRAAVRRRRIMFDGAGVQLMGGQEAIHRGQAEGAGLEVPFSISWRTTP